MTARYNIFKATETPGKENDSQFVRIAQTPAETGARMLPNDQDRYQHSVDNVPNVQRGHNTGNGG